MKQISKLIDKNEFHLLKKFLLNGLFATLVHYLALTIFSFFVLMHKPNTYGWSYAVGSIFGITSSFFGNKYYVFNSTIKKKSSANQFIQFVSIYLILMVICSSLMSMLSDSLRLNYNLAFILVVGLQTILNYLLLKKYVF